MICTKCDKDLAKCDCPDAPERIRKLIASPHLFIGGEYKQRLLMHAIELESAPQEKPTTKP